MLTSAPHIRHGTHQGGVWGVFHIMMILIFLRYLGGLTSKVIWTCSTTFLNMFNNVVKNFMKQSEK